MKAKIRNAMVTWNNPPTREWDDLVAMLNPAYMVGQLERGENGTLHWQFAIQWSHSRSFAAIKKDLPLAHFEEVRSWAAAVQYCQKEDSRDSGPWEYGNRPTGGFGKAQAEDWDTWYTLASEGRFKRFPPKFKLSTWATWNASTARTSSSSTKRMCVECGFGVSPVSVRATLPARCSELRVLPKLNNKWWDGYQSQKVVIMEDVDKETIKFLHHHLKIWSDRWGFIGETKGGAVAPSHRWLVVTSNYSIADILADLEDRELRTAIMRRFTRFEMLSRDEIKAWDGDYQVHPPEAVAAMFK